MRRTAGWALGVALIAGCTPGPVATTAADAEAKRFEVPPGMGAVYVVRGGDKYMPHGLNVSLDGRMLGWLGRRTYVTEALPPGRHTITCGEGDTTHLFDLATGQTVFVEALAQDGIWTVRCALFPLDDLNGRNRVNQAQRLAPPAQ